ncbi:MAG TPA: triple tyrosine motif-containing protein [Gemmatimonadaceae bacterium]|nr:triple tyrosine motif-containing protein [Gemmatimonadaceae bacterium]
MTTALTCAPLAALLLAAVTTPATGQALRLSHYVHTAWRPSDLGLPIDAQTIAQTPDGYLWLGTAQGLFRFDGVRARKWRPPAGTTLPSEDITVLTTARDGALWIGTDKGLASWKGDRLTTRDDIPGARITAIIEDSHGTLRVGLYPPHPVCSVRGSTAQCDSLDKFGVRMLVEDRQGTVWGTSWMMDIWRIAPDPPAKVSLGGTASWLGLDDNGNAVVSTVTGLARVAGDSVPPWPLLHGKMTNGVFRTRDGALWASTTHGGMLHISNGRLEQFTAADGLTSDRLRSVFEDREGNVWVLTYGGLDRFRPALTDVLASKRGLQNGNANSVIATGDGSVWSGTSRGLVRWQDTTRTLFSQAIRRPSRSVEPPTQADLAPENTSLAVRVYEMFLGGTDASGRVWTRAMSASYFDGVRFVNRPFDMRVGYETVVAPGENGATWFGYQFTVREQLADGTLRTPDSAAFIRRHAPVTALLFDARARRMWMGFHDGELATVVDGHLTRSFERPQGLAPSPVRQLRLAPDGALWAVLPNGVSRIDTAGRRHTLTTATGLPCERIDWSYESDDGALWLFGACGLIQISGAERAAWIRDPRHVVQSRVFGEDHGVIPRGYDIATAPLSARTADGRIWFVAGDGIEILDPRRIPFNTLPPATRVEEVIADGNRYDADSAAGHRLTLPVRVRNVEIQYSASSYAVPEKMRFRFKLEGQDPEWREVVNQRRVAYSNLRPGSYEFRLMASNNSGVWSPVTTPLAIHVPPAWNQTWWFVALLVTAIAAIAAGSAAALQQRRARLAAERAQARFEATLAERARVARELHDTLLGDMVGVVMQLHAGAKRVEAVGEGSPAARLIVGLLTGLREQMQRSLGNARRTVTAMREEFSEVSSPVHEQVAAAAARIFDGSNMLVRVSSSGSPLEFAPAVATGIVSIASEAMRNALRHAQCRTVTVSCLYSKQALMIAVRDDGRGFEPTQPRPTGHWGLVGMQERASALGATLIVTSAPHEGTEVSVTITAGEPIPSSSGSRVRVG